MTTQLIGAIAKSETSEIRISSGNYKGRPVLDIRLWYKPNDSSELVPSRKGLTIDLKKAKELKEILGKV